MEPEPQSAVMQIIMGFINGPPVWVWPLLVVLLAIGWQASKPRTSTVYPYYFLPFLGVMSVQSISDLAQPTFAWGAFAIAFAGSAVVFYRRQGRWLLAKTGRRLQLAGEWATMTAMMVVFWSNFVKGTLDALAPQMATTAVFCSIFAAVVGTASGSFLGRSVRIILANPEPQAGTQ